jgi:hypothetical protein
MSDTILQASAQTPILKYPHLGYLYDLEVVINIGRILTALTTMGSHSGGSHFR